MHDSMSFFTIVRGKNLLNRPLQRKRAKMGDTAACLRRSFSSPPQRSQEFSQGEVTRCLGESISFGRYMSEPLAWEKWSAFSNNRYLEEAEKYSKPGSVAKMKAFFEAHYGRFGARKKVAQEQANDGSSGVAVNVEDTSNAEVPSSSPSIISERAPPINCHSTIHESPTKDSSDVDLPSCGIVSSSAQSKEVENETSCALESVRITDATSHPLEVQVLQNQYTEADACVTESSTEIIFKDVMEIKTVPVTPESKANVKKEAKQKEKFDHLSEQPLPELSLKRSKKSSLSKLSSSSSRLSTPIRCKKEGNATPDIRAVSKVSASLARLATPVRSTKESNSNRKWTKESTEKKTPTSRAVHMSINVTSDINVMKKPSLPSRQAGVPKVFTPVGKIGRDRFAPFSTPNKASVNSDLRHSCATPQSETRRSRVALEKSFDRSRRMDLKLKSPSVGNVKASVQSPVTFSSFSFRTEERAAKRREFFQRRLEKEAESLQPAEKAKVKPTPADSRKSSQSRNLNNNAVPYARTEILSASIKKIPASRLQPPKCEAKPASDLIQEKGFRPPQRTAGSKHSLGNSQALPSKLVTRTKSHENTCPNIL